MRAAAAGLLALPWFVKAIQPSASDTLPGQELRELVWGDLNILHTTDNHGWHGGHLQESQYSADYGDYLSFVRHMRQIASERGVDLLVADSGDRAEGNGLWDSSEPKGMYTRKILRNMDFDLLTTGNHELYNGTTSLNEFLEMVPHFGEKYLSSNIDININGVWKPFANRTLKFTTPNLGLNITSFGFLFNFTGNDHNTRVTPVGKAIQECWFVDAITDPAVDLFLVVAHIDTEFPELEFIHRAIRAVNPHTPIQFLAGHAHQRKFKVFDKKSTAIESGRYLESVGWVSLSGLVPKGTAANSLLPRQGGPLSVSRAYIDFNRLGFQFHSNMTSNFDTPAGRNLSLTITAYRKLLDLNRLIGCAPHDFTLYKDPYHSERNWYGFLSRTLLPKMVVNDERYHLPHMIFINGGSQRFDVFKGRFTYDTSFIVSPFTSRFLYAPDIPYSVASQLLDYFLHDPNPYYAHGKGELPPIDPALSHSIRPDVDHHLSSRAHQEVLRKQKKYLRIQGYTTKDDLGTAGDDTVHDPFPKFPPPKVVQSNGSFPEDGGAPEKVDVIFFDFIAENVATGLNKIVGVDKYKKNMFKRYTSEDVTLTQLILEYAEKEWGKECAGDEK